MKNQIIKAICLCTGLFIIQFTLHAQSKPEGLSALTLEFNNVVGEKPLKLQDEFYTNAAGEKFTISTFNYFISNIKLHEKGGNLCNPTR